MNLGKNPTPPVRETRQADAPMGLDFEWPEDGVWFLGRKRGAAFTNVWGIVLGNDFFCCVFKTSEDCDAARKCPLADPKYAGKGRSPHYLTADDLADRCAARTNPKPRLLMGFVLLDRDLNELARRYCR
jgi:hypothetical protein